MNEEEGSKLIDKRGIQNIMNIVDKELKDEKKKEPEKLPPPPLNNSNNEEASLYFR